MNNIISTSCVNENHSLLLMYKDYIFLMHIATKKTYLFYNKLKILLTLINILLSASSSISNSIYINNTNDEKKIDSKSLYNMNIIMKSSMVINFILCFTTALIYLFSISQKEIFFKIYSSNYYRLYNTIENELVINKQTSPEYTKFIIYEFTFLLENALYDVPKFIKRKIKNKYYKLNIPSYLDFYNDKFSYKIYIFKYKDMCKNWLLSLFYNNSPVPKNTIHNSNSIDSCISFAPQASSPIKSYSTDSKMFIFDCEKVLSNSIKYREFSELDGNITPILHGLTPVSIYTSNNPASE